MNRAVENIIPFMFCYHVRNLSMAHQHNAPVVCNHQSSHTPTQNSGDIDFLNHISVKALLYGSQGSVSYSLFSTEYLSVLTNYSVLCHLAV